MGLSHIDLAIVGLYLVGITLFGLSFKKSSEKTLKTYFLADKNIPWWAISLSIVSAETSTLTIIGIPGTAYFGNFGFMQVVFGYLVARIVISLIFIPPYYRGELFTAYQLIDRRFGKNLHKLTAGIFLVTRAVAEGVRVFAISIVVAIALQRYLQRFFSPDLSDIAAIGIITLLTLIYTFEGGMHAVVWTDVVQMVIYIAGTIVGFVTLLHLVPGGWTTIHDTAAAAGKLQVIDWQPSLVKPLNFWAGVIGGTFLTTASHGTDQLMVQRLLAARSEAQAKLALLASGGAILLQFTLFLLVGASLWVYYTGQHPPVEFASTASDRIFPTFIVQKMPTPISGLLIAAILAAAMSNLSAALNSLSSTTVIDFYVKRYPESTESQRVKISRTFTIVWGVALFALAILSQQFKESVLVLGLSLASITYGGLLGTFLLGVLTKRANERGVMLGLIVGVAANLYFWLVPVMIDGKPQKIAWTWYVVIGTTLTMTVGYLASMMLGSKQDPVNV
jgi:SSS family solute:Na+ symporter